jgi:hypothetical protein
MHQYQEKQWQNMSRKLSKESGEGQVQRKRKYQSTTKGQEEQEKGVE